MLCLLFILRVTSIVYWFIPSKNHGIITISVKILLYVRKTVPDLFPCFSASEHSMSESEFFAPSFPMSENFYPARVTRQVRARAIKNTLNVLELSDKCVFYRESQYI